MVLASHIFVMLVWLTATPLTLADDEPPKALREWIELISGGQPALLKLDTPLHVVFTRTPIVSGIDSAKLANMRENARLHPDHPDKELLRNYESHAAHKDVLHIQEWLGRGMWRVATDAENLDGPYDFGGSDDGSWEMSASTLAVSSRTHPGVFDFNRVSMAHVEYACWLISGGMHQAFTTGFSFTSLTLVGSRWRAETDYAPTDARVIAEGEWSDNGKTRAVSKFTITWNDGGTRITSVTVASDWRQLPFPPYAIAGSVVAQKQTGEGDAVYALISADAATPREMTALASVPTGSREDPVRGSVVGLNFEDHRSNIHGVIADGSIASEAPMDPTAADRSRAKIKYSAWGLGLATVVTLVAFKVWSWGKRRGY